MAVMIMSKGEKSHNRRKHHYEGSEHEVPAGERL